MTSRIDTAFRARMRGLESAGRQALVSLHLRTQAARFVRLAVVAFAAQLATLGTDKIGWMGLAAVAVAAVETAARQYWPALPTAELGRLLRLARPAPTIAPIDRPATQATPTTVAEAVGEAGSQAGTPPTAGGQ